jgi:hypothetical protein
MVPAGALREDEDAKSMLKSGRATEVLTGGHLKGGMFRSHLKWVHDQGSAADLQHILERLPEAARRQLSGPVLATQWLPFSWIVDLDRAIAEQFGDGHRNIMRELGRFSAVVNSGTIHKLLEQKSPHDFFRSSVLLHSQFQDFGHVSYEETGPTAGRRVQSGCDFYSPVFCASAVGYYDGCIESHGGKSPSVQETECQCFGDPSCTFEMSWK